MILSDMRNKPSFTITPKILKQAQLISRELGKLSGAKVDLIPVQLRRINNIKTIQASLAIEGNTLELDQVTAIFEGKHVAGPSRDISEVKNAIEVYKQLPKFNPLSLEDLLKAHHLLMKDLIEDNGQWRIRGVGVYKGAELAHLAPPAKCVPELMDTLFRFLNEDKDLPWLIKACIFHYELEFIHPFSDGNGRMGRLWQQVILINEAPIFAFIPIEVLIKEYQTQYYDVLGACDQLGDSTMFIEFSLEQIYKALIKYKQTATTTVKYSEGRINYAQQKLKKTWFSRKDYMDLHKNISPATASRDLQSAVEQGSLLRKGEKNQVRYCFS